MIALDVYCPTFWNQILARPRVLTGSMLTQLTALARDVLDVLNVLDQPLTVQLAATSQRQLT